MAAMDKKEIRNFSIIAHIDHGKSTLSDRLLEITQTVEKRKMREQVLDSMELERERGITIKMQPVRMEYTINEKAFIFNLIDTPGHIDFAYEVSRSLKAVEGAILLVDAAQGVQAQTLSVLSMAQNEGLVIIPVINKIDLPSARVPETKEEITALLHCQPEDIILVSGKTGEGVEELLEVIVQKIPKPKEKEKEEPQALIFDFEYSNHRGVILYVRVFEGSLKKTDTLFLSVAKTKCTALEVGTFHPEKVVANRLEAGEIGYIVTGIKEPGIAQVGDTVLKERSTLSAIPGYQTPRPVVWASVYPSNQGDFPLLLQALGRLRLTDSALSFEEEGSSTLGKGFRLGLLGMLHLEIITERLRREFNLDLVVATPSTLYEVIQKGGKREVIYSPAKFPDHGNYVEAEEPWVSLTIITPPEYVGALVTLLYEHEAEIGDSSLFSGGRTAMEATMPLRELMRGFFDELKSVTSGFASLSYDFIGLRPADVVRLDILVAEESMAAFSRVVSQRRVQEEAEKAVEKLKNILPRQLFTVKIQAKANGRIIASRSISALRKDVTGYLYGGDITRKRKLWEKQKKGKKKLEAEGRVTIPQEVFLKMIDNR
jgi:GTP-binding protein LepA